MSTSEVHETEELKQLFSDVSPISTVIVPDGICITRLPPSFEVAVGYLRACIQNGEISKRVFDLTEKVITMNSTFVSAWVTRQKCVLKMNVDLDYEWDFLDRVRELNEKCYQTWMYRKFLVEYSGVYQKEKDYCDSYIAEDNKNIHSWSHRIWVVQHFDLYDGELAYTDKYIQEDVFNNSAWSHRFYVYIHIHPGTEDLEHELDYVLQQLTIAPHNEAAWNYLYGLIRHYQGYCYNDVEYEVKQLLNKDPHNIAIRDFLIRYNMTCFSIPKIEEGIIYCKELEQEDTTRSEYWKNMEQRLQNDKEFLQTL